MRETSDNKKKSTASELLNLEEEDESEVDLDSLGSFLIILLTLIAIRMTQKPARRVMKR